MHDASSPYPRIAVSNRRIAVSPYRPIGASPFAHRPTHVTRRCPSFPVFRYYLSTRKHRLAAMKIQLSFAILFCFKIVALLCHDATPSLRAVVNQPVGADRQKALTGRLLVARDKLQQCRRKDACKFMFFKGTKMHRKRVRGRVCVQGCMIGFFRFYVQRGWQTTCMNRRRSSV
jgi:hypothetical protein